MALKNIKLDENLNWNKIRPEEEWPVVLVDKSILFKAICELLLNSENLFYYASQKATCSTLEDCRKYVKKLIHDGTIVDCLSPVLSALGWTSETLDTNSTVLSGDIGEYLMAILVDHFLPLETIVCKVSLKTSPKMSSNGNDGIFYDYENKVLYYGEAKFYSKLEDAYKEARNSLQEHMKDFKELSFIKSHDKEFIAENQQKKIQLWETFETVKNDEVTIKQVVFLINEDIYKKDDYIKFLKTRRKPLLDDVIIIVLPILSKTEFLEFFKEELKNNER